MDYYTWQALSSVILYQTTKVIMVKPGGMCVVIVK